VPSHDRASLPADTWLTRERVLVLVLAILTLLVCAVAFQLVLPFVPSITWALVLAVIAHPLHRALLRRLKRPWLSSALTVLIVAIVVMVPAVFVVRQIALEASDSLESARDMLDGSRWAAVLERFPALAPAAEWLEARDIGEEAKRLIGATLEGTRGFLARTVEFAVGTFVTLFLLYYFLRDKTRLLVSVRSFVPLAPPETDRVVANVGETIRAIVYGTFTVGLLQGALGALMFWMVGLPAPLMWGTVMAILALVPILGAAVVWVPATLYLAVQGDWNKALLMLAWGGVVISLIDNLLYPVLVKNRLRLHTVPVFIAVLGGLVVFGATGVVLGPLVLAVGFALVDIWRRRMALGEVESGVDRVVEPAQEPEPVRAGLT
jgi:predicted PurR-regulated permease PerM